MLLEGKNAIIYGGAGAIGSGVARVFAREGARVHLAGRTLANVEAVAEEIRSAGGSAEAAQVDALDARSVDEHADAVVAGSGTIDVSFNLISVGDVQGTPLADMDLDDYEQPIKIATRTMFLTTRAAARAMRKQRSGVMLFFGGDGPPVRDYNIGGFQIALAAVESLRRQLASELGSFGIRTVSIRTNGIPEAAPAEAPVDALVESITAETMLKRAATLEDVGNVAAFAASDRAAAMTAATVNVSGGALVD